ncbi:hypothetical protein E8E14_000423 [Neopestalotiopsis sp. 37M]|nr:hypothetical protein E8E14_000423 [Neopestalotiopsis sp. 37M]
MESPNSGRGRGRFSSRKRSTVISASSSAQQRSELLDMAPSSTPAVPVAPASALTYETPSPSNTRGTRMRTRHLDGVNASPEDPTSKGGRSLRKRTRVDYSFDQADEEEQNPEPKATPTTTRSYKKRRTDALLTDHDFEDDLEPDEKQRALELPSKPIGRRSIGRRSTLESSALPADRPDDDSIVQDTIEVGGQQSPEPMNGSSHRRSSNASHKESALSLPSLSQSSALESVAPVASAVDTAVTTEDEPAPKIKTEVAPDVPIPNIEVDEAQPLVGQSTRASAREPSPTSTTAPGDAQPAPKALVDVTSDDPYARITPYIDGVTALYPALQGVALAPSTEPDVVAEETPQDTPPDDGLEDINEVPDDSTPAGSPAPMEDTTMNSPAPDVGTPDVPVVTPKKQYPYKKLRPAQDFIDFIADYETMPLDELYARLEHLTDVLDSIQQEHNGCRKVIDDEENAAKYQQEEQLFQHRVKLARSKDPNADPVRKDFVVKGIRAPKADMMTEYARQQDRVLAQAYGFEYDERESKIGQQDPIGQRGGIGKGRLRDRPKQTAKAAEADDTTVVHGKRSRKAPNLFGDFEPASRGSTPAPVLPRKRRGRHAQEDVEAPVLPIAVGQTLLEETPKKRGRGGRPRKHPLPTSVPEDTPAPELEAEEEVHDEGRPGRKRKRRNIDDDELPPNGMSGMSTRRRNSRLGEIPSTSFYNSGSTQPNDESRPNTASSTGTVSTTTSAYGLREKRQKRFAPEDEDGDFVEDEEQPKPKRIRRVPKKVQEQDFANIPASNIPDMEPNMTPVAKTPRIRLKNATPATNPNLSPVDSVTSMPGGGTIMHGQIMNGDANGGLLDDNKDYGQMTKSEKMSASMKARWASGSMSNAVAKRRATLAAKKAATQTPVPEGTPEIGVEQQELQQ